MELINVVSASHTSIEGVIDCTIEADLGGGAETIPFTYSPNDPHGLGPAVGAWLTAHPAFPISAYEPPAVPASAIEVERERRIALPHTVATSAGSFQINMDADSQRNIQGLATVGMYLNGVGSPQTTEFRDWQNQTRTLTPTDLVSMGLQVAQRIQAVYAKSWALKAISPIPADYTNDAYWN